MLSPWPFPPSVPIRVWFSYLAGRGGGWYLESPGTDGHIDDLSITGPTCFILHDLM